MRIFATRYFNKDTLYCTGNGMNGVGSSPKHQIRVDNKLFFFRQTFQTTVLIILNLLLKECERKTFTVIVTFLFNNTPGFWLHK